MNSASWMNSVLHEVAAHEQVRMIEIKLSQGAKPGKGGILPGGKVTPDIAAIRMIPVGEDSISPNGHPEIRSVEDLLDMVARVRAVTGKPTGLLKPYWAGWSGFRIYVGPFRPGGRKVRPILLPSMVPEGRYRSGAAGVNGLYGPATDAGPLPMLVDVLERIQSASAHSCHCFRQTDYSRPGGLGLVCRRRYGR